MPRSAYPMARKDELVIREIENETLIYDKRVDKAYCLNQTAFLVWRSCDGDKQPADIARSLTIECKAHVPEEFVRLALQQLGHGNLLEPHDSISKTTTISRRQVIRRIGLTTAIALPLVISLAIPTAATAASCACATPGDCLVQTTCPSTNNCNMTTLLCTP